MEFITRALARLTPLYGPVKNHQTGLAMIMRSVSPYLDISLKYFPLLVVNRAPVSTLVACASGAESLLFVHVANSSHFLFAGELLLATISLAFRWQARKLSN
jgi:hypothetical protein